MEVRFSGGAIQWRRVGCRLEAPLTGSPSESGSEKGSCAL